MTKHNPQLPVSVEYSILLALANSPRYGADIGQQILADTVGRGVPTRTSLYRALKQLEGAGFIRGSDGRIWERTYTLTIKGMDYLTTQTKLFLMVLQTARQRTGV